MIVAGFKQFHGIFRILYSINWNDGLFPRALCFAVFPFCFAFLNMCGITQHDIAKLFGCLSSVDRIIIPGSNQCRDLSGMVNMRMCQKDRINLFRLDRDLAVHIGISPLFHTAIHKNILATRFDQCTGSGYFMGCSDKCQFHICLQKVLSFFRNTIFSA